MPSRTPAALAALACAAVRGLNPTSVTALTTHEADVDAAAIEDDLGRSWVIRAPRTPACGARLAQETRLLAELVGWLPFSVPEISGTSPLPEGGRAVVHRALRGRPLLPTQLTPGPGMSARLGRALAAIHELPQRVIEDAGLPVYAAEEYRQRRLAELDRAAATGQVPAGLLARWERALEEVGSWRFSPCVVHADLAPENVLVEFGDIVAILEWGEAKVADPADDLAWVTAGADEDALDSVLEAYRSSRRDPPDRDLLTRARLVSELALARWLLHGVATDDAEVVDDACRMIAELDRAATGALE